MFPIDYKKKTKKKQKTFGCLKIGFTTESDMGVAQGYTNVQKLICVTFFCLFLNLGTCIIGIHTALQKFAYPCATRYADFIGFYGTPPLKYIKRFPTNTSYSECAEGVIITDLHSPND